MEVVVVLIPVSIVLVLLALRAFAWSVDSGQFDELDREAQRILFDEGPASSRRSAPRSDTPPGEPPA